jgi:hypothetical protein
MKFSWSDHQTSEIDWVIFEVESRLIMYRAGARNLRVAQSRQPSRATRCVGCSGRSEQHFGAERIRRSITQSQNALQETYAR